MLEANPLPAEFAPHRRDTDAIMAPDDRTEVQAKLIAAWRAAAERLIEAGYEPGEVFEAMATVALSGVSGHAAHDRPRDDPSEEPPPVAA